MCGTLYLCATPIGNLEDITLRVINTLKRVDLIAAEDTRHSKRLLNYYEINTPITSYHEHNKSAKGKYLINLLKEGKNIALITDAGTPAISDPGEDLVAMALSEKLNVTSLPGACACIAGLTLSGLPTRRFVFEGFLPNNKKERDLILHELKNETRTIILYEAPHRLKKTLEILLDFLDNKDITIIKEITKRHETIMQTTIKEALAYYENMEIKGEFVLVIKGQSFVNILDTKVKEWEKLSIEEHMDYYFNKEYDRKEAMKLVAKDRNISKRDVYNYLIKNTK